MRRRLEALPILLFFTALVGCASWYTPSGDLHANGASTAYWSDGSPAAVPNFVLDYETSASKDGSAKPFHRMRTVLELCYDPHSGRIHSATVRSSKEGHALRQICLSPDGSVLKIRMATLFDGGSGDRTVVDMSGDGTTASAAAIGIGPTPGLVERLEVKFGKNGAYSVEPETGAYLAGADLTVVRRMTKSRKSRQLSTERFP